MFTFSVGDFICCQNPRPDDGETVDTYCRVSSSRPFSVAKLTVPVYSGALVTRLESFYRDTTLSPFAVQQLHRGLRLPSFSRSRVRRCVWDFAFALPGLLVVKITSPSPRLGWARESQAARTRKEKRS
jgi:hypothetical protein